MPEQISGERKAAYYVGMALMILGVLLFASTFVTFFMNFGDFSNFESDAKSGMLRAFGGMALLIIGAIIRGIGALGVAGSGVKLSQVGCFRFTLHLPRHFIQPFLRNLLTY